MTRLFLASQFFLGLGSQVPLCYAVFFVPLHPSFNRGRRPVSDYLSGINPTFQSSFLQKTRVEHDVVSDIIIPVISPLFLP